MSTLSKTVIPSALLITLALCAPPAFSASASADSASSVSAASAGTATATSGATQATDLQAVARLYGSLAANTRAAPAVLVVPAKEITPETYDRVVEDLSVMSRIIEKSVRTEAGGFYNSLATTSLYTKGDSYGHTLFLPSDGAGPRILRSSSGRPKAIHVGGYGAVFSLRVGFPLVPPPEGPKPEKAVEQIDEVWSAAQRELADPQGTTSTRRARPAGQPYRAEAVEELKNTLTATLKHASNIRDLEPESWLMLLVQGPGPAEQEPAQNLPYERDLLLPSPATAGGTLLTLRAKKTDIDQFAKGQLGETQFRQRVQIVTH